MASYARENYFEKLRLAVKALVSLGLAESRAVAQITASQEEQEVKPAFDFVPIFKKNGLETSKCFMRWGIF